MKILFVCTGGICRSPMAEIIFENLAKAHKRTDIFVRSAGVDAQPSELTSDLALKALKECGEGAHKPFQSTKFTPEMVKEFNYIFCMAACHKHRIDPQNIYKNVRVLTANDVRDPWGYGIDVYKNVCKQLQTALKELYDMICRT